MKNIVAYFCMLIMVFYSIPKDLVHSFMNHNDAIHYCLDSKGDTENISTQKSHCAFLHIDQLAHFSDEHQLSVIFETVFFPERIAKLNHFPTPFISKREIAKSLRGPPADFSAVQI
jgi:hypothetical protein